MLSFKYMPMDKNSSYKHRWFQHLIIGGLLLGMAIFVKTNFEVRADTTSQEGWTYNPTTQHYYKVVTGCNGWNDCEYKANSEGAHLVTINDANEQDWLVATFGSDPDYGIGFTDVITEANWIWISGETASYTNWYPGEPSNSDYLEHYAEMNFEDPGKWNDVPEEYVTTGIIERTISFGWIYNPTTLQSYKLATGCYGWHSCEDIAENEGAHLVTVNDANEQDWLVATFGSNILYWIGFTDEVTEANWVWISGETVSYTNWSPGEPSDDWPGEDHAIMNWGNPGKWNDIFEAFLAAGIIERNDAPVKLYIPIVLR